MLPGISLCRGGLCKLRASLLKGPLKDPATNQGPDSKRFYAMGSSLEKLHNITNEAATVASAMTDAFDDSHKRAGLITGCRSRASHGTAVEFANWLQYHLPQTACHS